MKIPSLLTRLFSICLKTYKLLLILENYPACSLSEELVDIIDVNKCDTSQAIINASCTVHYSGNVAPQLIIREDVDEQIDTINLTTSTFRNQTTSSRLMEAKKIRNGTSFICEIVTSSRRKHEYKCQTPAMTISGKPPTIGRSIV